MNQRALTVAVAANFTPDLVKPAITHWLGELGIAHAIEIAPYNQLFQELIDPASLFGRTRAGINVALIRLGDWARREGQGHGRGGAEGESSEALARHVDELIELASAYARREGAAPLLLIVCPEPPATRNDPARAAIFAEAERRILDAVGALGGALAVGSEALLAAYPTAIYDDPASDELGHIPYTQAFFAAIGTVAARRIRAYVEPPHKVLALDCDNTIWSGVVGEDGAAGVTIDAGREAIQRFATAQHEAGVLICLASKNVEDDVDEVFRTRTMPLEKRHVIASRVSWQPKSQSLRELAHELNLGLDSFVFVDDSRIECAEVRAGCPDVLTIELPSESDAAARVIANIWAFDRWKITAEDRKRGELYRQNVARDRTLRAAPSMDEFLAGLDLKITVAPPTPAEIPRTAQLTFRTNQLNTTTVRRDEAALASLLAAGKIEALAVTVSDRFGDYGLVGVALFDVDAASASIRADTFLLSCRVLQRGVEHRMVARLGEIAVERGLAHVTLPFVPTAKNLPARDFLRSLGDEHAGVGPAGAFTVRLAAADAAALVYRPSAAGSPGAANAAVDDAPRPATSGDTAPAASRQALLERLAREVHTAEQIQAIVQPDLGVRPRPEGAPPIVAPRDALEDELARLCEEVLGVRPVGVTDDLFLDFGADSLAGVRLAKEIGAELGHRVEVGAVLEARTVERLARAIRGEPDGAARAASRTLYTYRRGGHKRPIFLVRPASNSGGSLSYVALARSLDRARPLHTFLNRPLLDGGALYASVEAMADEYIAAMRSVQPRGPYLLAGWCLGGKVAFEMASRLVAAGDEVAALVLFDTLPPATRIERLRFAAERVARRSAVAFTTRFPRVTVTRGWKRLAKAVPPLRTGREQSPVARFLALAYWAPKLDDAALIERCFPLISRGMDVHRLSPEARWERVFTALKKVATDGELDGEVSAAATRRGYAALAWDHRLDAAYAPKGSYPGAVHHFLVRGGAARCRAWQRLCAQRIEEQEFPIAGTARITDAHNAMMQRENVPLFAEALNRVLDAADARVEERR
ncbi:MAG: HAD-IIIC family phosphatase [Byssovorax sp.]